MARLRVATVGGDPEAEAQLATQLEHSLDLDLYIRCVERPELLAAIRSRAIDVVVAIGAPHWFEGSLTEEFARNQVAVVGYPRDPLEAMLLEEMGADLIEDLSNLPAIGELCRSARPPGPARAEPEVGSDGKLITVWGPKGAPGRTTVAIELAFVLAATDPSTLLIDGDPFGGDIAQMLGVEPGPGVLSAARSMLDETSGATEIERGLTRAGPSGPIFLPGLARPSLWSDLALSGWRKVLSWSRANLTTTIVDSGPSFGALTEDRLSRDLVVDATLAPADIVVCVVRADPVGVRNFLTEFPRLEEIIEPHRIRVVLNRLGPGEEQELRALIRRHTGIQTVAQLPDAAALARAAVERGRSITEIHPDCDLVAAVRGLAAALGGEVRPRGLLTRLIGR